MVTALDRKRMGFKRPDKPRTPNASDGQAVQFEYRRHLARQAVNALRNGGAAIGVAVRVQLLEQIAETQLLTQAQGDYE